jgi:PKD repeat protein
LTRHSFKQLLFAIVALAVASPVLAQGWPVPAKTPNTPVKCPASSPACAAQGPDLLTAAYSDPIKTFIGRFLDSQYTRECQFDPFRTLRARLARIDTQHDRIYMIQGSHLVAYTLSTFFSRLEGGEPLNVVPRGCYPGTKELYLPWATYFYAEASWDVSISDGQDRLFDFDFDDRGFVYPAYSVFGWGALHDDASSGLTSQYQQKPDSGTGIVQAYKILSVKSGGNYYVVISDQAGSSSNVFNMGTASTLTHDRMNDVGLSINHWAKSGDGSVIGILDRNGSLRMFTNDSILVGRPTQEITPHSGYDWSGIASDGTNFYAVQFRFGSAAILTILTPNGSSGRFNTREQTLPQTYKSAAGARWGAGYLTVFGDEGPLAATPTGNSIGRNLRLYKTAPDGSLSDVDLNTFFARYYHHNTTAGYVVPINSGLDPSGGAGADALTYKQGTRTFIIVSAGGLGDVYELRAGDSITPNVKSVGAGTNPNSLQALNSGPYYGDKVTFTSTFSSPNPPSVNWTFGDGGQTTAPPSAPDVTYQYGGLTNNTLPASRTVSATSASDPTVTGQLSVTVKAPTIRLGIKGHPELLFLQPDVSSAAPIVTSDEFTDASDGALESHFNSWSLDGTVTKAIPSATLPVGACGRHTLIYTAHYGPNDPSALTMLSSEASYSINPFTYNAMPFTVGIADPTSDASSVTFTPSIRATTKTSDLPAGLGTSATYRWDLLNANDVVDTTLGPATKTLGTIDSFVVPRSKFGAGGSMKVRLTIDVAPAAACASQSQTATLANLTGPDATVTKTGCANVGSPCSFTVTGSNQTASWTYEWAAVGAATFTNSGQGPTFATFAPQFTVGGDYSVTVKVSNALGTANLGPIPIHLDAPACSSNPTTFNTAIWFGGTQSGCIDSFAPCTAGEKINYGITTDRSWTPSGNCEKYSWDFGDGSGSTDASPSHTYAGNGSYTIKLHLTGGLNPAGIDLTKTLIVGPSSGGNGNGNGNGGNGSGNGGNGSGSGCSNMLSDSAYIGFNGASSGCTSSTPYNCSQNENITFDAHGQNGYNIGCTTHTYSWNFGDPVSANNTSNAAAPVHSYSSQGTFNVSLTLGNGAQTQTFTVPVKIGSGVTTCPPLKAENVTVTYYSVDSACKVGGSCAANQVVTFLVQLTNYSSGCSIGSYSWTFNDDNTNSQSPNPTHTFKSPGDYTVTVNVGISGGTPVPVTVPVHVVSQTGCTAPSTSNVYFTWTGFTSNCTPNITGDCKEGETVGFQAYANPPGVFGACTNTYQWDFGDKTDGTTGVSANHKYVAGVYDVKLTVTNSGGSVTLTQKIRVANESGVTGIPGRRHSTKH